MNHDVTGKVTYVFSNAAKTNLTTRYIYDDRGFHFAKELYNTGVGRRMKLKEHGIEWGDKCGFEMTKLTPYKINLPIIMAKQLDHETTL